MFDSREGWAGDLFLRAAGLALLAGCWLSMRWLFHAGHHAVPDDMTAPDFAAAAAGFLCFSAGGALATFGRHLLDRVESSERWKHHSPMRRG